MKKEFEHLLWIFAGLVATFFVSALFHNLIYALFGFEEAFFFIIAIAVVFLGIPAALIYSLIVLIAHFKKKRKRR